MNPNSPRLVCGTDFSANARVAADVAAALAVRLNAHLDLVHVAEDIAAHASDPKSLRHYLRPRDQKLRDEAARLRTTGAEVAAVLLQARWAEDALLKHVRAHPTRLVIVSSVSKTGFDRWTLGSVSEKIAQSSPCPTLVVRNARPLLAWARKDEPLKVFAAVDFSESGDAVLRWAGELRKLGPCAIVVGHVNWPPEERHALGLTGSQSLTTNPPSVRRALERNLRKKVEEFVGDDEARILVHPSWGRPDAPLVDMAVETKADVIVLGTHQRHGLPRLWHSSVSRGILHHSPGNVVCVPSGIAGEADGHLPRFKLVLIATDFSTIANAAIPYAYAVPRPGGIVKLVHVIPPWEPPGPLVAHYESRRLTHSQHNRMVTEARRKLRTLIPRDAEATGIITEAEVIEHHDAAAAICEEAERAGADVICLASHGRAGLSKALFGSVAQAVMKRARGPVMIVRAQKP